MSVTGSRLAQSVTRGYRCDPHDRPWLTRGRILYTSCDEDSRSELEAFGKLAEGRLLSITGSGCRSLNLLAAGPEKVISVDANPLQNHLLELKAAAIAAMSFEQFAYFIGLQDDGGTESRVAGYRRVRGALTPACRRFWDLNRQVIDRGILFSGAHETFLRLMVGGPLKLLRRRELDELLSMTDVPDQIAFYDRSWDTLWWRRSVRALASPRIMKTVLGDPSYFQQVNRDQTMADYFLQRLRELMAVMPVRDNPVLTMALVGRYLSDTAVPMYLSPKHYGAIQENIGALRIVTSRVDEYLSAADDDVFDAFSLSDISGWTSPEEFARIMRGVVHSGRPGARFCYRNFLTDRPVPEAVRHQVDGLPDVSQQLAEQDAAGLFTFEVGEVREGALAGAAS